MAPFPNNFALVGISCVLVGKFNPGMFSPAWLKYYKLVRDSEADAAKIQVIHPSLTQFTVGNFTITAEENRFLISTIDQSSFEPLKDLILSVLALIESTPVTQLGINTDCHFKCKNEKTWHAFGHKFALKSIWDNFTSQPGLHTMTVQGKNPFVNDDDGYVRIKVEPSKRFGHSVYLQVNNHFDFKDSLTAEAAKKIVTEKWAEVLMKSFDKSVGLSKIEDPT